MPEKNLGGMAKKHVATGEVQGKCPARAT